MEARPRIALLLFIVFTALCLIMAFAHAPASAQPAAGKPPLPGMIVSFGGSVLLCDDLSEVRAIADAGRTAADGYAAKIEELKQTPSARFPDEGACVFALPPPLVLISDLVELGDGIRVDGKLYEGWAVELKVRGFRAWTIFRRGMALTPA